MSPRTASADPGSDSTVQPLDASLSEDLYRELRGLARRYLRGQPEHTLQPTALVHEAYLKLARAGSPLGESLDAVGLAARTMRHVLVNHARDRRALKRGPDRGRVELDEAVATYEERCGDLLGLDAALSKLARVDPRQSSIVELRFFGGLSIAETSRALGLSVRTVNREWRMARAWLRAELRDER